MKIVLLAATGKAGKTILAELIARGHQVIAVARSPEKLPANLPDSIKAVKADFDNAAQLAEIMRGADAVVSAFGPASTDPRYVSDIGYTDQLVDVTENIISATRESGVPRLIVVGGAGSLEVVPGITLLESGYWPEPYVNIAKSHVKAFAALRSSELNWTYFSPPALIQPGERTGIFRTGTNQLITDPQGNSRISYEDYAVALVDELEQPQHERARFTVGY